MTDRIAIFASGSGSNAEAICRYFQHRTTADVVAIVSNRRTAGVHKRAEQLAVPSYHFTKEQLHEGVEPLDLLNELGVTLIVLAGYMCLITPPYFERFTDRILNIHPALLDKYGGQGMYGQYVHEAVVAAHERLSGITIHLVDEIYDHGRQLCQVTCPVYSTDTPDTLAERIHPLEHRYYPITIENYLFELRERP